MGGPLVGGPLMVGLARRLTLNAGWVAGILLTFNPFVGDQHIASNVAKHVMRHQYCARQTLA